MPVLYKGQQIGEHRPDLVVENGVVVEIKSVERFIGVHRAQVLTYMPLLRVTAWLAAQLQQRGASNWHPTTPH